MKEKVINARVSEDIYKKILDKSHKHRTTVSRLLRNILEDVLDTHDEVADSIEDKLRAQVDQRGENVIGYQEITLTKDTHCSLCRAVCTANTKAYAIMCSWGFSSQVMCAECQQLKK